jgi:hypothetical protein
MLPALSAVVLLAASPIQVTDPGATFAQPGKTAQVRISLRPGPDVLFNRRGPSQIQLEQPFGRALTRGLPRGEPWPGDPTNYDRSVPEVMFDVPVPSEARPGRYPLTLRSELYLCDASRHACFRVKGETETVLEVGSTGPPHPVVLQLSIPGASS